MFTLLKKLLLYVAVPIGAAFFICYLIVFATDSVPTIGTLKASIITSFALVCVSLTHFNPFNWRL